MQKITKKLIKKMLDDFKPVAENMAKNGLDEDKIVHAFVSHIKIKQSQYYNQRNQPELIRDIMYKAIKRLKSKTSKAEFIFHELLEINNIKFEYQYPIGPYFADFMVNDSLVLEIDGPHHDKGHDDTKDKYLKKMGYKVMRVPLTILFHSPQAIIEEIRKECGSEKSIKI